jgi:hypothetical protein
LISFFCISCYLVFTIFISFPRPRI